MQIERIDHFVLTVASIEATCRFYVNALGVEIVEFAGGRKALSFGTQKINLHERGREFEPKASQPTCGSADFCLISSVSLDVVVAHLTAQDIEVEQGIVARSGANGPIRSIYIRDPDGNLVEIATYD
ncbi:MAG: VOC family protein [Pseudomonadota bacterium]